MPSISRLPLETLLQIFFSLYDSVDRTVISAPKSPLAAARLTCSFWNSAITETSGLWTTLHVNLTAEQNEAEWAALFALHLKRSNDMPLDIVISGRSPNYYVFLALVEHITRWRSLTVPYSSGTNPAHDFMSLQMPNLVTLHLNLIDLEMSLTRINTPGLQRLVWGSGGIRFVGDCPPPLRVMKLPDCDGAGYGGYVPFEIILQLQDTIQELSYAPHFGQAFVLEQHTTFHQLHTLRLGALMNAYWLKLMEDHHFPNLHTLDIKLGNQLPPTGLSNWPSIQRLEWGYYYLEVSGDSVVFRAGNRPEYLEPFLPACSNLSSISFVGDSGHGENSELSVLARRSEGGVNDCKELEEIETSCARLDVLDELTVRRPFLKSISMKRWHSNDLAEISQHQHIPTLGRIRPRVRLVVQSEDQ